MKKTIVLLSFITTVISCGGGNSNNANSDSMAKKDEPTSDVSSKDPEISKGLDLVAKSDCFTCHKVAEASTGPSYKAVAQRYANRTDIEDSLVDKIIKGGAGNWGQIPMTPHPALPREDVKTMVKYVLSLKD